MVTERFPTMRMKISSIRVTKRFRQDLGDLPSLANNIKQVGELLQPIVVDKDNVLVCGERRLEACKLLKWKSVPVHVLDLDQWQRAFAEASENADAIRKGWTMSERVRIAEALSVEEKKKARERQLAGRKIDGEEKGQARDKVAALLGVSPKHLERAKTVVRIAKQFPKNKEAQEALVLLDQPKQVAKAWSKATRVQRLNTVKRVQLNDKGLILHTKDFRKVYWTPSSVDLVFTDPPWQEPSLYEEVAKSAELILKPGRFCMVYCATTYLAKVIDVMRKHLNYCWQFVINYDGQFSSRMPVGCMRRYTSVLVFVKGNAKGQLQGFDSYKVDVGREPLGVWHKWQQALTPAVYFIESNTARGDTVVDFCLGSGTFAVAARGLDRRFIGCDPDPVAIRTARHRIATEQLPQRSERALAS
ncbi:MAG: ParB N-terminal domain-containing protein [Gemmatales bacterium]